MIPLAFRQSSWLVVAVMHRYECTLFLLVFTVHHLSSRMQVTCTTTVGEFQIELYRSWSPIGFDRFLEMVDGSYFDGQALWRAVNRFVVQFGIPATPVRWVLLLSVLSPSTNAAAGGTRLLSVSARAFPCQCVTVECSALGGGGAWVPLRSSWAVPRTLSLE